MHIRLDALCAPPLVELSAAHGLMIVPPSNPGGGHPNAWHPPHPTEDTTATGAMIYEDVNGHFNSETGNGFIRVRSSDGMLLIVPPQTDPVYAGAIYVDGSGDLVVSTGIA